MNFIITSFLILTCYKRREPKGLRAEKKLNSKTRINQGKKNAPKRLDIFNSILQKGYNIKQR